QANCPDRLHLCLLLRIDVIAHRATQGDDAAVEMARGMNAVGQQRPGMAALEIKPQPGTGKAGMADSLGRTQFATRPALIGPLPAMGAARRERGADQRVRPGCRQLSGSKVEQRSGGTKQTGMARALQGRAIVIMDFAAQYTMAPGVVFGSSGIGRIGRPGKARSGIHGAEGSLPDAFKGEA